MKRSSIGLLSGLLLGCATAPAPVPDAIPDSSVEAVARVLDDWHAAASEADEEHYFEQFAADGVFLGTDASERWTVEQFRAYAHPHFASGRGWTYVPSDRHVFFSADGRLAWFDEKLENEKYGQLRGTGVLRWVEGRWKLAHYSMSFTIPNEITSDALAVIRGG
jgi:hypothetical protein